MNYRISSFKRSGIYRCGVYEKAVFILKIKIEENDILFQFKAIRYLLSHAV